MAPDNTGPLDRFFTGLSEYVFHSKLGVVDPQMVDYISSLLIRFTRNETHNKLRLRDGRLVSEVMTMMAEAQKRVGEAKREIHRYIGDYTLFWSGLYPEALSCSPEEEHSDHFVNYCAQGKRAYQIASSIASSEENASNLLLERMSSQFEMCAYGLREIRNEWENKEGDNDGPLLL